METQLLLPDIENPFDALKYIIEEPSPALHRAWRRERVSRGCKHGFRSDCRLGCTDYSCELVRADGRSLAAVEADRDALRTFVAALRDDGLDIDDPTTAPVWTGKIHVDGRLVFDLATVGTP